MSSGGPIDAALNAKLAQLSPERRALVERMLRERAGAASAGEPAAVPNDAIPRRGDTGPAPLSSGQELLWAMDQAVPDLVAYNVPRVLRIDGPIDVDALRAALDALVARHEALRTRFVSMADGPRQVIDAPSPVPFETIDLRGRADASEEAQRIAIDRVRRRFELSRDLLLRATLIRLDDAAWTLVLVTHHIVCDEWSRDVTFRELGELYAAHAAGRAPTLAELPIQYADYAAWQRTSLSDGALATQLAYWREQLRDLPRLELPTDRPPAPRPSAAGARRRYVLPASLQASLVSLARAQGVSLNMLLLAAYSVVLARHAGQDDVVVGSPVSARQRVELEGLIGYFPNTVVLRTRLHDDPTFAELLRRTRETSLAAFEHQNVPLEQLALDLQAEGTLGNAPLFDVVFAMQGTGAAASLALGDATVTPVPIDFETAKFDLVLVAAEGADGLHISTEYRTALFDGTTIDRFVEHLQAVLEGAIADPECRVSALPITSADERRLVVETWNATDRPLPEPVSLHGQIEARAAEAPDAVALGFLGETVSFAEMDRRATAVAAALRAAGVGDGTIVGLCVERSLDFPIGVLGILKAGGAWLPLDPTYPPERLAFMVADSGAPVLLTQRALLGLVPAPTTIAIDEIAPVAEAVPGVLVTPDAPAYVIYTSGSTGTPKGVMLHHRGACNLAMALGIMYEVTPADRILQFSALSFDASVLEIVWSLVHGASLHLAPRETIMTPELLAELVESQRLTGSLMPPVMLRALDPATVPSMTAIVSGGDACGADIVNRWAPGRRFYNAYGPSEITVAATVARCYAGSDEAPPIGGPLANYRVYVLDPRGEPVPIGVPGELWIGGAGVGIGYLNRPELNAERFVRDPFVPNARMYKSGDRARWRPDGRVEYLGRLDNQVKVNGFRIELGEVESALSRVPGVEQALVLVTEPRPGDKQLVAYWVGTPASAVVAPLDAATIRATLRERLPAFMLPSAFVRLDALPLLASGKVDRRKLPAVSAALETESERVAPRTPIETRIAEIWCEVLRVPSVGVTDDFLALGGHSLLAIRVLGRLQAEYGVRVPLSVFFAAPTIEALAASVVQESLGDGLAAMLASLEAMSDADAAALHAEGSA